METAQKQTSLSFFKALKYPKKQGHRGSNPLESKFYMKANIIQSMIVEKNGELNEDLYNSAMEKCDCALSSVKMIIKELREASENGYEDLESYCLAGRPYSIAKKNVMATKD